jgi:hypothetical protein
MDDHERRILAELPARIDVYRGYCVEGGQFGLAWSLDRELALAFAARRVHTNADFDGLFIAHVTIASDRVLARFEREAIGGVEVIVPNLRGYHRKIERVKSEEQPRAELGELRLELRPRTNENVPPGAPRRSLGGRCGDLQLSRRRW